MDPCYLFENDLTLTPRNGVENNNIGLYECCDIISHDGDWELKHDDYYIIYKNIKYKYITYKKRSGVLTFCSENDVLTNWVVELRQLIK